VIIGGENECGHGGAWRENTRRRGNASARISAHQAASARHHKIALRARINQGGKHQASRGIRVGGIRRHLRGVAAAWQTPRHRKKKEKENSMKRRSEEEKR